VFLGDWAELLVKIMPTDMQKEILRDLLLYGCDSPNNISDRIGRSRSGVSTALADLADLNLVASKGRGVWALTYEGVRAAQSINVDRDLA